MFHVGSFIIRWTDSKDEDSDNEENSEEDEIQATLRNPFDLLNEDEWTMNVQLKLETEIFSTNIVDNFYRYF